MKTTTQIHQPIRLVSILVGIAVSATASMAALNAHAGDACALLRAPDVERALPMHTPWKDVSAGSSSACRFTNDIAKPNRTLSLSQRFHISSADAVDITRKLRVELEEDYVIELAPELGRESFYYTPRADTDERADTRTTQWVVQQQRLVLMGMLVVPAVGHMEEKAALGELLRKVLDANQSNPSAERTSEAKAESNDERGGERSAE
jgi:hypothetical protein